MAATQKKIAEPVQNHSGPGLFAFVAGLFLFVSILKFGNPVILDDILVPPENFLAAVFESWRVEWGYWLMLPLIVTGLFAMRWKGLNLRWPLALCWVIRAGLQQHFGGLEATRQLLSQMKDWADLPPGTLSNPAYLKRIASSRIFSTFSNPDALAGAIELLLPVTLVFLWQITPKVRTSVRMGFVAILGGCGLACVFWSGSKGGWLITLIVGTIAFGHSTFSKKWKQILIYGLLIIGIAGFGIRYAASLQKQQVSVSTRFTYWRAAFQIAAKHPLLGTGPGTFSVLYSQIKQPGEDFARLCHNDYLEQASDSGFPGFLIYTGMILAYLSHLYRCRAKNTRAFSISFAVWLGLLGLCLHSAIDYHLYIPALAWPMFFLTGFALNSKD